MNKSIAATALAAALALGATPASAESGQTTGVFAGAAIGALAGGPLGLVIGSAAGGLFGLESDRRDELDTARADLNRRVAAAERDRQEVVRRTAELERRALGAESELGAALLAIENGFTVSVPFRTGSDHIDADRTRELARLAEALKSVPQLMVHIDGRTDARGGESANRGLGQERAEAVRALLEQHGIAAARIARTATGKQHATHPTDDVEGLFHDRRAVITFHRLPK